MSGYLTRLLARSDSPVGALRPATRSRFSPPQPGPGWQAHVAFNAGMEQDSGLATVPVADTARESEPGDEQSSTSASHRPLHGWQPVSAMAGDGGDRTEAAGPGADDHGVILPAERQAEFHARKIKDPSVAKPRTGPMDPAPQGSPSGQGWTSLALPGVVSANSPALEQEGATAAHFTAVKASGPAESAQGGLAMRHEGILESGGWARTSHGAEPAPTVREQQSSDRREAGSPQRFAQARREEPSTPLQAMHPAAESDRMSAREGSPQDDTRLPPPESHPQVRGRVLLAGQAWNKPAADMPSPIETRAPRSAGDAMRAEWNEAMTGLLVLPSAGATPPGRPALASDAITAAARRAPMAASSLQSRSDAPTTVQVSIGTLEIRATVATPAVGARQATASRGAPRLTLDDYLRQRSAGTKP